MESPDLPVRKQKHQWRHLWTSAWLTLLAAATNQYSRASASQLTEMEKPGKPETLFISLLSN